MPASLGPDCTELRQSISRLVLDRPELLASWVASHERASRGEVDILGLGPVQVGSPPRWHRDPVAGIDAPVRHWSTIPFLDPIVVGDHKRTWEFNRHQYLLGSAFLWIHRGDIKYFSLVQTHLESWLDQNPPGMGINWASSLEVAYRSIAWCWLLCVLKDAPWDPDVKARLLSTMDLHAQHVESYLSTYFSPNTHLTGEALGLFYVGTLLPESEGSKRWRSLGARILEEWADRHIRADGTYVEQSSQYLRYTVEIYLHYVALASQTGWPVGSHVVGALGRSLDVLRAIRLGDGCIPLIGDDDGGYLLPLGSGGPERVDSVLVCGAVLLNRSDLLVGKVPDCSLAFWLACEGKTKQTVAAGKSEAFARSQYFASGGLAVIRDGWQDDDAVAVIDAGPHGFLNGGHAHSDALSMTLALGGQQLFVDRGTLTYIGAERNEFRSTTSHNTVEFGGTSSAEPLGVFQWVEQPTQPAATFCDSAHVATFWARSLGHPGTTCTSLHERFVCHVYGGAWLIQDSGRRATSDRAIVRWQCAAGLAIATEDNILFEVTSNTGGESVAHIVALGFDSSHVLQRDISRRYGDRAPAPLLELSGGGVFSGAILAAVAEEGPFVEATGERAYSVRWRDQAGKNWLRVCLAGNPPITDIGMGVTVQAGFVWTVNSLRGPESNEVYSVCILVGVRGVNGLSDNGMLPWAPDRVVGCVILETVPGMWRVLRVLEAPVDTESR